MTTLALLPLAAPVLMAGAALFALTEPGMRPRRALEAARWASLAALAVAALAILALVATGPATSMLIGVEGIGLSARLDALSAIMLALVAFVGAIVIGFSRSYMDGDPRQGVFTARLCLTLAAVMVLVTAGNLALFVAAWIATSLAFHGLLVFYGERKKAVVAARKKFVAARIGDLCLIVAAVLMAGAFGTTDIATIAERATAEGSLTFGVGLAAFLIATAALLKCAAFPTHGWLTEVMETPTPVSALLHAGIINAGGFLVVRFADVMVLSAPSLHLLAIVGGFTALFGAVVMLTQTSVKVALAWSTVAQMGFMLLQCGLGLFALAVLHLVAHALYKAHAFLSSGSVVEIARASWVPDKSPPRADAVGIAILVALALYLGIGSLFGLAGAPSLQLTALGAILVMGLTLFVAQSMAGAKPGAVVVRSVAAAAGVSVAYFGLHALASAALSGVVPPPIAPDATAIVVMVLAVGSFAVVTALQLVEPARATSPFWRAARVHIANGLYANALFDRLVGALKVPARTTTEGGSQP